MINGFKLEVVKTKSRSVPWAIKATRDGVSRYRYYYYKSEALRNMKEEWKHIMDGREFMHNFTDEIPE